MLTTTRLPHLVALTAFLSVASLALFLHTHEWTPLYSSAPVHPIATNTSSPQWCKANECSQGHWVSRQPRFTSFEEFQIAYANPHDFVWRGCVPIPLPSGIARTEEEKLKASQERLLEVVNWVWVTDEGIMKEWDAEEFVVRLLRRPGGLIMIGDSLTGHHFFTLGYLLQQVDIAFDTNVPSLPRFDEKNVRQHILRPGTPMTQRLLERAGVPASRLERPILTLLNDHMLVSHSDIREITELLGAEKGFTWYYNYEEVEGWVDFVRDAARGREGEESVTQDTVLLMNVGAHWSRGELGMLPRGPTEKDERYRVKEALRQVVARVGTRLSPIPRLSIYYRSTTPGHPNCERHPIPYPSASVALTAEQNVGERLIEQVNTTEAKVGRSRWDWDQFGVHNEIWKRAVGTLMKARGEREWVELGGGGTGKHDQGRFGARWFYMDLWEQTLQRVDAHTEPGSGDCLHWCLPGVVNQWTYHLNHLLFLEDEQTD